MTKFPMGPAGAPDRTPGGARRRRRRAMLAVAAAATVVAGATAAAPATASTAAPTTASTVVGAVYVATNAWAGGNKVLTFPRHADGTLGPVSSATPTGGLGAGPGQLPKIVDDPLGSQGSLVTDPTGRFVFVVNAGSGSVSSLAVSRTGLTLVDTEPSAPAGTGQATSFPVGLAVSGSTLWVLNGVGDSLTGFTVTATGHLQAFQNCALPPLPAGNPLNVFPATATSSQQPVDTQTPGQVGFSPDGRWLVVTSKEGPISTSTPLGASTDQFPFGPTSGPGHLYAYPVGAGGRLVCGRPGTTTLPTFADGHGTFPFSFTWSSQGRLLLTEVFGESDKASSVPGGLSAVSSFTLNPDGTFTLQRKVPDPLPVPCWIVRSANHVFVASFLGPLLAGGGIATYTEAPDGGLVDPTPGPVTSTSLNGGSDPIDLAVTGDGRYLYQLAPGANLGGTQAMQLYPFAVGPGGTLTPLAPANTGLGGVLTGANSGAFGIATVTFP